MNANARMIVAATLLACGFSVQAQQAAPDPAVAAQEDTQLAMQDRVAAEPHCLRYTGSLVIAHQNRQDDRARAGAATKGRAKCNGSAGNSYSREEIDRTGATDLADALRKLDPAVW